MDNYTSLRELYLKLLPVFKVKLRLAKSSNQMQIKEKDIWYYLQNKKWKYDRGLTIADMTSDIINVDIDKIISDKEKVNEKEKY